MALALFGSKDRVGVPAAGDWRCMGCNELMLAKYPNCRKCGAPKPESADLQLALAASAENQLALAPLDTANSPIIAQLNKGEDWTCPLCKEVSFANRVSCRRCGCPRPEGAMVVQTVQHQLSAGGYIGYLPDVNKIEATSSWAKQWNGGPLPGQMNLGMMQMTSTPFDPNANYSSSCSSDSSSSSGSESSSESKAKKKRKANDEKKEKGAAKSGSSSSSSGSGESPRKRQKESSEKKDKGKADDVVKKNGKIKPAEEKEEGAVNIDKAKLKEIASKKAAKEAKKAEKAAAKAKEKAKLDKKRAKAMDVDEELEKRRLQRERRKARTVTLV